MTWLRDYRAMRRARFTRAERRALRAARNIPGTQYTRRDFDLLMRFDAARGSL
jgi:hypothetical protein